MKGHIFNFPKKIDGDKASKLLSQMISNRSGDLNLDNDDFSNLIFRSKRKPSKVKKNKFPLTSQKKLNKNGLPSIKRENAHTEKRSIQQIDYSDSSISEEPSDDYYDFESTNSFLSSSSSTDEINDVLGDKVENAIYDIYGEDIPQSAIEEIKDSISFLLKEQVEQLPESSDKEHDSESAYSDLGTDYLDTEMEYSDKEKSDSNSDLDLGSEYSDLEQANLRSEYSDSQNSDLLLDYSDSRLDYSDSILDYSDLGIEYSGSEKNESDNSFMSYFPEYDDYDQSSSYEDNQNELSLEQMQAIQEKQIKMIQNHQIQMQIMQDQQYQLQIFQYGVPMKRKPIRIYTKKSLNLQKENQKKKLNINPTNAPAIKKKNQSKMKNHDLTKEKTVKSQIKTILLNDFNSLPLKSQHTEITNLLSSLPNTKDKSAFNDLSDLIQFLMKLDNISETTHYLEIFNETENNGSLKITECYPNCKKIYFCYNLTELIKSNDSIKSSEFTNILSKFKEVIAEIIYPSPSFDLVYSYFSQSPISIGIFIRDIAKTDVKFKQNKNIYSVKLDSTVKAISESSFEGCKNIRKVIIPSSVKLIGSNAFSDCKSLKYVSIPSSVTSIGEFAFCDSGLLKIDIPPSLTTINRAVFRECQYLSNVTIPNSITKICNYAFFLCSFLENVSLPSSVTCVEESAFEGSPASKNIPASLIQKVTGNKEGTSKWKSQKKTDLKSQILAEKEKVKSMPLGSSWPMPSNSIEKDDDIESEKESCEIITKSSDNQNDDEQPNQSITKNPTSVKIPVKKSANTLKNSGSNSWGRGVSNSWGRGGSSSWERGGSGSWGKGNGSWGKF